jgi:hypothetical protein
MAYIHVTIIIQYSSQFYYSLNGLASIPDELARSAINKEHAITAGNLSSAMQSDSAVAI